MKRLPIRLSSNGALGLPALNTLCYYEIKGKCVGLGSAYSFIFNDNLERGFMIIENCVFDEDELCSIERAWLRKNTP